MTAEERNAADAVAFACERCAGLYGWDVQTIEKWRGNPRWTGGREVPGWGLSHYFAAGLLTELGYDLGEEEIPALWRVLNDVKGVRKKFLFSYSNSAGEPAEYIRVVARSPESAERLARRYLEEAIGGGAELIRFSSSSAVLDAIPLWEDIPSGTVTNIG